MKEECRSTGKSPKKPRHSVKRFRETSEEDVLKIKHPEHLDYNLEIFFVSILMYLIWLSGAADEECFHFITRESLTLLSWTIFIVRELVGRFIEFFFFKKKKLYFNEKSGVLLAPI